MAISVSSQYTFHITALRGRSLPIPFNRRTEIFPTTVPGSSCRGPNEYHNETPTFLRSPLASWSLACGLYHVRLYNSPLPTLERTLLSQVSVHFSSFLTSPPWKILPAPIYRLVVAMTECLSRPGGKIFLAPLNGHTYPVTLHRPV
jgi:hypothetical protein